MEEELMSEQLVERLLVKDIPVYRFYENSREAVDTYVTLVDPDIEAHANNMGADKPIFYVLDVSRSGMFSVNYMRQKVNKLVNDKPRVPVSYIAYITSDPNDSILVNLIDALTARQLEHTRKIFLADQFDDAIDWLVSIREKEYADN